MKFENSNGRNGHRKDWSDLNHNGDHKKVQHGRLAYITVQVSFLSLQSVELPEVDRNTEDVCLQENAIKWWVTINGLNHHEVSLDPGLRCLQISE